MGSDGSNGAAGAAELRTFAGIDEAGLGPILGPLTLGFSVFRAPAGAANLWERLGDVVTDDPRQDKERFVVADSKRVFTRNPRGRARLERTALGFLALLDPARHPPGDARALLTRSPAGLGPAEDELARHPWYAHLERELPCEVDRGSLELRVERLHRALRREGVELVDAGARAVPVGCLNRSYATTGSKGLTLWDESTPILRRLWEQHAEGGLRVVVDRHGGRFRYAELLGRAFPGADVEPLREGPSLAEYSVRDPLGGARRMRIAFAERAEGRSFAVALASCLAKYVREISMRAFNAYFVELQPDLKPTAGYRNDGWRWMEDAAPALERADLPREVLLRER